MRVPSSGSQPSGGSPFSRFSSRKVAGHTMKITWSRVTMKSCIIVGTGTSISSLRTRRPSFATTW